MSLAPSKPVCIDKFGVDGHRELAEAGVTDNIVIPWVFDGLGFDAPIAKKKDSLKRFADTYIHYPLGLAGRLTAATLPHRLHQPDHGIAVKRRHPEDEPVVRRRHQGVDGHLDIHVGG